MRAGDDFEAAVRHVGRVDGEQDGQVLDVLDVRVGGAVDVGREAARAGELVVDLLLEEGHGLAGELGEGADEEGAAEEAVETGVGVCEVLG